MTDPVRLQLSRKKGFDLQAVSLIINGLPAVNCARPGPWGNHRHVDAVGAKDAVAWHRFDMEHALTYFPGLRQIIRRELGGKNLACWCAIDAPHCHVDWYLELANKEPG